jgi:ketosteroid isomerase-like protein
MSQENVEVAKAALEAFQQRDIDRFLSYIHREVEWNSRVGELEGTHHGHDGVRWWWAALLEVFPDWSPTIREVRELDDFVLFHADIAASGAGSGLGVDQDFWQVAEIQGGRIVWYRTYPTEQEASKPWRCGSRRPLTSAPGPAEAGSECPRQSGT